MGIHIFLFAQQNEVVAHFDTVGGGASVFFAAPTQAVDVEIFEETLLANGRGQKWQIERSRQVKSRRKGNGRTTTSGIGYWCAIRQNGWSRTRWSSGYWSQYGRLRNGTRLARDPSAADCGQQSDQVHPNGRRLRRGWKSRFRRVCQQCL